MQRNGMDGRRGTNRGAEKDAAQPLGGQPRDGDEDDLQQPETVPSFLTAREFAARDEKPRGDDDEHEDAKPAGERHAAASFEGDKGEPTISDEAPPRGKRGLPGGKARK